MSGTQVRIKVTDSEVYNHTAPVSFQSYMNEVYEHHSSDELRELYGIYTVETSGYNVVAVEIDPDEIDGLFYDYGLYLVDALYQQLTNE